MSSHAVLIVCSLGMEFYAQRTPHDEQQTDNRRTSARGHRHPTVHMSLGLDVSFLSRQRLLVIATSILSF
jgi:hypothetical protein